MSRKAFFMISILAIFVLALSACAPQNAAPAEVVEEAEAPAAQSGNGNGSGDGSGNGSGDGEAEAEAESPAVESYALTVSGLVETEMGWSEDEVKAMNTLEVKSTNSKGEADTYTGVLLSDIITAATPKADAATVVFVADDGYTAEVGLAEVMDCADCILSFRSKGGFSSVLPDLRRTCR